MIRRHTAAPQAVCLVLASVVPGVAAIPLDPQRRIVDQAMPAGETADLLALSAVCPGVAAAAALAKDAAFTLRGLIAAQIARAIREHAMAANASRSAADARDAVGPTTAAQAVDVGADVARIDADARRARAEAQAARALDRRGRSA